MIYPVLSTLTKAPDRFSHVIFVVLFSHGLMYTLIWYVVCETNIFWLVINIARHHMDLKYRPVTLTLLVVRIIVLLLCKFGWNWLQARTLLFLSILILDILKFCMYVYKASLN